MKADTKLFGRLALLAVAILVSGRVVCAGGDPGRDANGVFLGKWTYRSWINDPAAVDIDPSDQKCEKLTKLLFAEAELVIDDVSGGQLRGRLNMGTSGNLSLFGSVAYGAPFSLRFQGVGKDKGSPSEGWVYDYIGWVVPSWPNGIDQRLAIVGSVVRTVPHSNGQAKAGKVASFIAVKKD